MVLKHDHLQLRDSVGISPTSLPRGTFDLTAFANARGEILGAPPSVEAWSDTPNVRSATQSAQLLVIAILLALIVGAVIFARAYIDSTARVPSFDQVVLQCHLLCGIQCRRPLAPWQVVRLS